MTTHVMISPASLGSVSYPIHIDGVGGKDLGAFKLMLGYGAGQNELLGLIFLNPPPRSRVL